MSFDDGSGEWMNPPPPGTVDDSELYKNHSQDKYDSRDSRRYSQSPAQSGYEDNSTNSQRSRSHSRSVERHKHRRRRSRSREYRRRRSRSRSRSSSSRRRYDKKYYKSHRSKYSRSRSRSRSRRHRRSSYSRSRSPSPHKRRSRSYYSTSSNSDKESYRKHRSVYKHREYTKKVYAKQEEIEEEEETEPVQENTFKNDGSFLEMFKKMQEAQKETTKPDDTEATTSEAKKTIPIFGKRRGGRILKTGVVQKLKNPNEVEEEPKDAWSVYMKEVRKYKEACCDDDSKTRPLVK